jgi:hypothetical protein
MLDPDLATALLRDTERYLSAMHGSVARHDNLAANYGCAGCELRDQIAAALRRMADEAHPAEHTWAAELHDPTADEWVPGTRYITRDRAVNALAHAKRLGSVWKDGTPVERRLVRATTTYTVETAPAVVAQPDGEADTCPAAHGALGRICELPTGHAGMHTGAGPNGGAVWQGDAS